MNFNPHNIRYGKNGIPIFSAAEIETIATAVLEKHCPRVLARPSQTPVLDIIQALQNNTGLLSSIEDLGLKGTAKILGKVNFRKKTLYLDISLTHDREVQFRFTAAHEIGHWILHRYNYRNWKLENQNPETDSLEDDEKSLCRLEQKNPRDWLEWQANVFAAALVMPKRTFQHCLIAAQEKIGIKKNLGVVYLSTAPYSYRDFNATAERLGTVYGVSKESVRVRLRTLKFLVNTTDERTRAACQTFADILRGNGAAALAIEEMD